MQDLHCNGKLHCPHLQSRCTEQSGNTPGNTSPESLLLLRCPFLFWCALPAARSAQRLSIGLIMTDSSLQMAWKAGQLHSLHGTLAKHPAATPMLISARHVDRQHSFGVAALQSRPSNDTAATSEEF